MLIRVRDLVRYAASNLTPAPGLHLPKDEFLRKCRLDATLNGPTRYRKGFLILKKHPEEFSRRLPLSAPKFTSILPI